MLKINAASIPRAEKVIRRASCLSSDVIGDCVKITGPKVGGLYPVARMNPLAGPAEAQAVGIIIKKFSATTCFVQGFGPVLGVFSSLIPGSRYFVGTNSQLTLVPPTAPLNSYAFVQFMGVAWAADEFMLDPHIPMLRHG